MGHCETTSETELDEVGRKFFGSTRRGVFAANEPPPLGSGFSVQSTMPQGVKIPALRRDRTGVVLKCTREHPSRVRKGAFLYTILFDDPPRKVERLPARGADGIDPDNENVEFLNDTAV